MAASVDGWNVTSGDGGVIAKNASYATRGAVFASVPDHRCLNVACSAGRAFRSDDVNGKTSTAFGSALSRVMRDRVMVIVVVSLLDGSQLSRPGARNKALASDAACNALDDRCAGLCFRLSCAGIRAARRSTSAPV